MTRDELLPKELLGRIPALYSNEETDTSVTIIRVKFFLAGFTWLVMECEIQDDDMLFFGYVVNHNDLDCSEWGYFTLNQLMEVKIFGYIGVERDLYFEECTFKEYMKETGFYD